VEQELLKYRDHLQDLVAERTHKLQVANEELETFSYSVSHDLRAPLRSIDGFSMALFEDYYSKLDDSAKDHIKRIRASTKHMGQLIDDMLSLSKVARYELKQEEVDLSGLAGEVMCQLIDNEPTRDIDITIKDTPRVMGDATLLQAVLENLFSNTWKFTKNTNNPCIEFGCLQKDGEDVYYVRDNGIGFDMKYSNKLFGTFNRLHKQEDYEGTGIGLATVKRIIKRHGGKVWADSKVGNGATFYFTLSTIKTKPQYKQAEKVLI
jgi:light-regulated signal transduction histidine kinase (bacteriophytochrome)